MSHPGKILIVDDEDNIRAGLRAVLAKAGHEIEDVATAEAALSTLATFVPETAVVDIRMPGMSGTALLQEIRARWPHMAVIMLTGHGTLETAMAAVKAGAHDYLLKPAKPDVIRQVVESALAATRRRRAEAQFLRTVRDGLAQVEAAPVTPVPPPDAANGPIKVGNVTIDCRAHEVTRADERIDLTPSEYNLLVALASRPGEVIDYVNLVRQTLDVAAEDWEAKELIKRHVFTLRQKLEPDPSQPRYVLNVRGVGYRFARSA